MGSGGLAPGQTIPTYRPGGGINAAAGAQSGSLNDRKFNDMEWEQCKQQFSQQYPGASGIAGTRVRNTPEYKAAEEKACPPPGQPMASPKPVAGSQPPSPTSPGPTTPAPMGGASGSGGVALTPPPGFTPNTLTGGG